MDVTFAVRYGPSGFSPSQRHKGSAFNRQRSVLSAAALRVFPSSKQLSGVHVVRLQPELGTRHSGVRDCRPVDHTARVCRTVQEGRVMVNL